MQNGWVPDQGSSQARTAFGCFQATVGGTNVKPNCRAMKNELPYFAGVILPPIIPHLAPAGRKVGKKKGTVRMALVFATIIRVKQ